MPIWDAPTCRWLGTRWAAAKVLLEKSECGPGGALKCSARRIDTRLREKEIHFRISGAPEPRRASRLELPGKISASAQLSTIKFLSYDPVRNVGQLSDNR